jgi:hypothetical protein
VGLNQFHHGFEAFQADGDTQQVLNLLLAGFFEYGAQCVLIGAQHVEVTMRVN